MTLPALIASDVDGTLLDGDERITPRTHAAVHAAVDEGVTFVLEVPTVLAKLPASVDVAAYRIICEALTNVTRHAQARSCAVRLWVDDDLHIEVVDDGVGIGQTALTDGGVGLTSMRERASELGGDCLVEADREGGTRVFATLPLPKETS